jgi:hypothetical protein
VLAAYCKCYRYIQEPASLADYIKARQTSLHGDAKAAAAGASSEWRFNQRYKPYATDLLLSQARVDYMQQLNIRFGVQKRLLPYDTVADMSLARDAVKLIS